jgi:DNA repair protein SbcC/Rad50
VKLSRVSILVGDNGAGKSAVLRALRWVMLNEWPGEAGGQVTWGEDECAVTLSLDGHVIRRGRKSDKNLYMLDDQKFHAFGTLLPQPVSALTRVVPENFQDQDEPAFWLYLSRGQAATALNEIFSLDSIDSSLANVGADLRRARMKASVCQERLEDAQGDEERTRWAVQADARLQELEGLQQQLEVLDREILHRQEALEVLTTSEELRMRRSESVV